MKVYLDTEFTDFNRAELLSLGAVSEDGREFYAEIHEAARHRRASDWVQDIVLTQFDLHSAITKVANDKELGLALHAFLDGLGPSIELLADFNGDLVLTLNSLKAAGKLEALGPRLKICNMAADVHDCGLEDAWDSTFKRLESESGLLRHHALLDARALRAMAQHAQGNER